MSAEYSNDVELNVDEDDEFIITDDPNDDSIIIPTSQGPSTERQYDDENDEPVFYDCDELSWMWDYSQWRALPNHIRIAFLSVIHEFENRMRPRVLRIMDVANSLSFYAVEYKEYETDFTHWLLEDFLVNMDYYDPFIVLRCDFSDRDRDYVSTAKTTFTERFIINANTITETYSENPNESGEVDDTVYV